LLQLRAGFAAGVHRGYQTTSRRLPPVGGRNPASSSTAITLT
jgi:hypothetical protein